MLIHAHYPVSIWSMIILFPIPLIAIGALLWRQPYRLWNSAALPYYLYIVFCTLSSGLMLITLGIEKRAPVSVNVPLSAIPAPDIDWHTISEQLLFWNIRIWILCVPLWLVFLGASWAAKAD
jgi:hypothetical protein